MIAPHRKAVSAASRAFGVPEAEIIDSSRFPRPISRARWAVFALLRERGWSTMRIGHVLDMDHTTVMNAYKNIPHLPPDWHAAYAKAREYMGKYTEPRFKIVYNRPIGPPRGPLRNKANCARPNRPRPPSPDEIWAKLLGGHVTLSFTRRYSNNVGKPMNIPMIVGRTKKNFDLTV